ncbi:amino acid adenylation domain-containing protein, partial [Streptomyces sp. XM4011]|uniref:non-ribosomal peptide synthetase n=1 Tax=Streptomyces sp. XM4011 TaxID=2929780 RepID=UPI001FFA194D
MDNGIRRPENSPAHSSRTLRPRPADRGPLSFGQQRLWFLDRWLSGRPVYNVPVTLRFTGPLPAAAEDRLLTALHTVAAGQDVLFTVIEEDAAGEPRQRVLAERRVPGRRVDLSPGGVGGDREAGGDAGRLRARAEALVKAEAVAPFDLAAGPMLRFVLLRLADDELWLHLTFHHIACDGWSVEVFQRQLLAAWERDGAAEDAGVQGAPRVQFADYALWQREAVAGPRAEAALGAWEKALDGAPEVLDLGTGKPRPAELSHRGRTESFPLTGAGVPPAALETFAAEHNATLYMVLLASFQTLVARHSGGGDIVLGSPVAGRGLPQLNELIGFFADSLVIRTDLSDDPSFRSLVGRARAGVLDALGRSRVPFDVAVQRLRPERSLSHTPVVQVVFALHEEEPEVSLPGGVEVRRTMVPTDTAKFDLTWSVYRGAGGLRLEVEYATDLFDAADVAVLVWHWQSLLEHAVREPDLPVSRLELMPAGERELVGSWSGDGRTCASGLLHERVAERAAETPDAIAVVSGDDRLTYRELDGRANALAHELRNRGIGPEIPVGLLIDRSAEALIAALGVLKAGGVYVPLDTTFPGERLRHMLTETRTPLVLTHGTTPPTGPWTTLDLADCRESVDAGPEVTTDPENACYVIFTSGSTGKPKGTTVTHRNVTRLFTAAETVITPRREDVWSQFHSLAFDFSVWEIWGPLTTGARLVIIPHATARDTHAFHALVRAAGVTVLSQTPTAFRAFEEVDAAGGGNPSPLRAVVFGGEPLHQPSVRAWADRHGYDSPALINMYGITETTVHVTHHRLTADDLAGATPPVGRGLPDLRLYVLGPDGLPAPIGVTGELYVGGAGVARGYTGQPALTADRFVPDPYGPAGARLYRTGDLGYWTPDGTLHHRGRADQQIKVRGHRLEPAEIEAALHQHPDIAQAHITHTHPDSLTAYLTTASQQPPNTTALRAWLTTQLPPYAIPHHFVHLPRLPLTPQGKIDTRSLPAPDRERPELAVGYEEPLPGREAALTAVWRGVLGTERIGRHDSFFDLGGDSIRAIRLLGRAREAGLRFGMPDLLERPTVARLAEVTEVAAPTDVQERADDGAFTLLSPEDRDRLPDGLADAYPMAELQVGMVYEMESDPDRLPYLNVETLRLPGEFDEAAFRQAVGLAVARHPALRTSFDLTGYSEPVQLVHHAVEVPLTVTDLRERDEAGRRAALVAYIEGERQRPFVLESAPLWRMAVHVLGDAAFQWTITEHHAVLDGWSLASTLTEIHAHYRELRAGRVPGPVPPRSRYRDFVAAERAALASPVHRGFWHRLLADRPGARLPRRTAGLSPVPLGEHVVGESHERDAAAGHGVLSTPLPAALSAGLDAVARRCGVPFKSVVLAAHLRAVGLATGNPDVLVGLTANGRLEEPDGEEARGLFLNTVPFRLRLPSGSWADVVRAVFAAERELLPHRRYPMAALRRELGSGSLFDATFTYNHFHQFGALAEEVADSEAAEQDVAGTGRTDFVLGVTVSRDTGSDGLRLELEYDARRLTADQVTVVRDYHLRALRAMAAEPDAPHGEAVLLGAAERELLAAWSGAEAGRVDAPVPVPVLLRDRALRDPEAVALEDGARRVTYAELEADSARLARRLRRAGVGRGDLVGICLPAGRGAVTAVWAVWRGGAAVV